MAVSTVDKLQFLSFILAVLLPVTVHFIAFRLGMHTKILLKSVQMFLRYRFSRWQNFIWRGGLEDWTEVRHLAKFCRNWSINRGHITILRLFTMGAAAILIFQIHEILLVDGVQRAEMHGLRRIILPNFVKIGQTLQRCCSFSFFFQGRHLGFVWGTFGPPT